MTPMIQRLETQPSIQNTIRKIFGFSLLLLVSCILSLGISDNALADDRVCGYIDTTQDLTAASSDSTMHTNLTLQFDQADIRSLINTVSQIVGVNFVVDPRVDAKVTVVSGSKIRREDLCSVFVSILEAHGFAVKKDDRISIILPI